MRVIAGAAKGRRLVGPAGRDTRPMTDRAREALFSSLGPAVAGARVLDLYAGAGTLGLEALSRGAESAVFVERDRKALAALRTNVAAVALGGEVAARDVAGYVAGCGAEFDVVFVDPPYALAEGVLGEVLADLDRAVSPGGVVIVHRRAGGPPPRGPDSWETSGGRRYGDTMLWRFDKPEVQS